MLFKNYWKNVIENQRKYRLTKGAKFTIVLLKNDSNIELYSIHNEGKSVVAERFLRTLKAKIYKYMTWVSENVYINKLDGIVSEYNNTYHRTIKIKPIDVTDNTYLDFTKKAHDKDPKFKIGDQVRIPKYKNIIAKGYMPSWSEEFSVVRKLKIQFHGHMWLMIIMVKKLQEHFIKKNYRRLTKKNSEYKK